MEERKPLLTLLKEAIQKEYESCVYYERAAAAAVKPACKRMFLRLAEMERSHAAELRKQLEDLEAQLFIDKAITGSF